MLNSISESDRQIILDAIWQRIIAVARSMTLDAIDAQVKRMEEIEAS